MNLPLSVSRKQEAEHNSEVTMASVAITMAMVASQFLEVGLNTIIKAATANGMSKFVFIAYSNVLAFCFLLPSTFLYHRFPSINSLT